MRRLLFSFVCSALIASQFVLADGRRHSVIRREGFVPDAETAIRIAVAVWSPIYGEKKIQDQKPYKAQLRNGIWIVEGSLPRGRLGGIAIAEILKSDARILRVSHGK